MGFVVWRPASRAKRALSLGLTLGLARITPGRGRAVPRHCRGRGAIPLWEWTVASGVISVELGFALLVPLPVASSLVHRLRRGLELPLEGAAVSAVERA